MLIEERDDEADQKTRAYVDDECADGELQVEALSRQVAKILAEHRSKSSTHTDQQVFLQRRASLVRLAAFLAIDFRRLRRAECIRSKHAPS